MKSLVQYDAFKQETARGVRGERERRTEREEKIRGGGGGRVTREEE